MAHFYCTVRSKGTRHTKCGNKDGMSAHIRGWNIGCEVYLLHYEGIDYIEVYLTDGSSGHRRKFLLTTSDNKIRPKRWKR